MRTRISCFCCFAQENKFQNLKTVGRWEKREEAGSKRKQLLQCL